MDFQMVKKLTSGDPQKVKGQRSNPKNFGVEYLPNGTR